MLNVFQTTQKILFLFVFLFLVGVGCAQIDQTAAPAREETKGTMEKITKKPGVEVPFDTNDYLDQALEELNLIE